MAVIGYYNMDLGKGATYQQDVIVSLGDTARKLTTLADLKDAQVLYLDNPDNFAYNADFLANQSNVLAFAANGGVVVMNDRFADGSFFPGYSHDPNGQYAAQVDFVNDTGVVADGPGGTLTDFSLDNFASSNHGVAEVESLQDQEYFAVATVDDPTRLVTTYAVLEHGGMLYSTIPTDHFVGEQHDPDMTAFAENLLQYAVQLQETPEVVLGSAADTYVGTSAAEDIFALEGADKIKSGAGDDFIHGGTDNDKLNGGAGDDIAWGGAGIDVLKGGAGNDQLWGGSQHDKLVGGLGNDYLLGGSGNDIVRDFSGDNSLLGGSGDDVLEAGDGFDKLSGGSGFDTMTGGGSADTFYFGLGDSPWAISWDVVTDFVHGQDLIDLTGYGISDWAISTSSSFSGTAHEILIFNDTPTRVYVAIDLDGDSNGDAFFEIQSLNAVDAATVTDFNYF